MHELSIAAGLIEQIVEIAEANQLPCIDEVELNTGALRQVVPAIMQMAFKETARGTVAQEAVLTIKEIRAKAECNRCSSVFEPEPDNYVCPLCQVADVSILEGNEIILKSVACNEAYK